MFSFFRKNSDKKSESNEITIDSFCNYFNNESDINVLKFLNIPLGILTKATQSQIDSNIEDKNNGVIEVYFNSQINLFGIFKSIVFKVYNDGSKQYFLHTTTDDVNTVKLIANKLYENFGEGNFNSSKFSSFLEKDKIENIAKGIVYSEKDECVNWWTGKNDILINYQIYLQYRVNPIRQLILNINERPTQSDQ